MLDANVRQGSPVYEAGHVLVLASGGTERDLEVLLKILTQAGAQPCKHLEGHLPVMQIDVPEMSSFQVCMYKQAGQEYWKKSIGIFFALGCCDVSLDCSTECRALGLSMYLFYLQASWPLPAQSSLQLHLRQCCMAYRAEGGRVVVGAKPRGQAEDGGEVRILPTLCGRCRCLYSLQHLGASQV